MISGESVMTRSGLCALWQVAVGCFNTRPLRTHDALRRESSSTGLSTEVSHSLAIKKNRRSAKRR